MAILEDTMCGGWHIYKRYLRVNYVVLYQRTSNCAIGDVKLKIQNLYDMIRRREILTFVLPNKKPESISEREIQTLALVGYKKQNESTVMSVIKRKF